MALDDFLDKFLWGPQETVKRTKNKVVSAPRRAANAVKGKITPKVDWCTKAGHKPTKARGKKVCARCGKALL